MPAMSVSFHWGEDRGWLHDEGHAGGVFRTFDALDLGFLGPRKVHLFVPRADPPAAGFPVIYVHDGDTVFWPGGFAGKTWDLAGALSEPGVTPRIVVALHPKDRGFEYTHTPWAPGMPSGGLADYAWWLAFRVKPWVDAHLPTDPRAASTAVLGASHGGLASFWAATRHPDVFGHGACFSSSFFSGLDDLRTGRSVPQHLSAAPLVSEVAELLRDPTRRPHLWMDWGTRRDGGDHNRIVEHLAALRGREMSTLLQKAFGYVEGVDLFTVEHDGAGHDENAWAERVRWWLARAAPRGGTP